MHTNTFIVCYVATTCHDLNQFFFSELKILNDLIKTNKLTLNIPSAKCIFFVLQYKLVGEAIHI